ncbi:putative alpha-1,2-mannosidase [Kitasatospora sp. MAP12-15]|uniref:lectin n=1 Tax=unclassified Kitasatospora TaxID=2633591 RepID=UPI0024731812|nr:lectin [Kitasatospora sp. MAP12-44]MDH6111628.1 putative alpha-1,2-mannosidase [Kitasatospora sp. MAP12-44]
MAAIALAACSALLSATVAAPATAVQAPGGHAARTTVNDPAQYVNPFVGTKQSAPDFGDGGGAGNTFPGASAPLGMVQWSPDTVDYQHGGYVYGDQRIRGFSLTHISGAGCGDYGNIPFMPMLGSTPVGHSTFTHAHESASPGSYAVTFDNGLTTELAATQRSGIARFSYPAGQTASLTIDAGKGFNAASGSVTVGTDRVSGYTDSGGFCGMGNRYRIYFTAVFDHPFSKAGIVTGGTLDTTRKHAEGQSGGVASQPVKPVDGRPQTLGGTQPPGKTRAPRPVHPELAEAASGAEALVSFDTSSSRTVTARVGISFVSADNAVANLTAEQGSSSFDQVKAASRDAWNGMLGRIAVSGGEPQQLRMFYSALYHSMLHPSVLSDVDGRYPGFDGVVHTAAPGHAQYADFSGWDVYRSQVQLLALLAPQQASDIAQSVLNQGTQGGYFDRWTLANGGTGVMIGDPLPIIAADIQAFGATDFDAAGLLRTAVAGSRDTRERGGFEPYEEQGYVPVGTANEDETASDTLEYASADFALSQVAGRLGDTATHDTFLHRSANWRNLFNTTNRYIQPRNSDHSWPDFTPDQQDQYAEGNGAQYTWAVPWNHRGLFDAIGGDGPVATRLDDFFQQFNAGPGEPNAYLGNEPTINTPWTYDYAGRPDRTQDVVRQALTTLYSDAPEGEPGNDDLGELSSWAVWSALGMYPQVPGRAELVLASPLFPAVTITRGNGVSIDISAPGASQTVRYVHGLRVNGADSQQPWTGEQLVTQGGTLEYTLAADPDPVWGHAAQDAPPSFDVGPATPSTGPVTGLAGKCLDVRSSAVADGTPVQLFDCNSSTAQSWTPASDGSLRALGKCLDVSSSAIAAGSQVQLWSCNGTGAQQWWPRADGTLVNPPSGRCLDVPASDSSNGNRLQIWGCDGTAAQQWQVTD